MNHERNFLGSLCGLVLLATGAAADTLPPVKANDHPNSGTQKASDNLAATTAGIVANANELLGVGKFQEAIHLLEPALSLSDADPRMLYLYGSALVRAAIAHAGKDQTIETDFFTGMPLKDIGPLDKSIEAFERLIACSHEYPDADLKATSEALVGRGVHWCEPADERYSPRFYSLMSHVSLQTWGSLEKFGAPRNLTTLKEFAVARLTTAAQYLPKDEVGRLGRSLTDKGISDAHLKLQLNFSNMESEDFWVALLASHPADQDLFLIATVMRTRNVLLSATEVVSTYNRIIDDFPILAADVVGWAKRRGGSAAIDESKLRKRAFPDQLKVRVYRGSGLDSPARELAYTVVNKTGDGTKLIQEGLTGKDGSFTIPKRVLAPNSKLFVDGFPIGMIEDHNGIVTSLNMHELLGTKAPDLMMIDVASGREVMLSEFRGKIVYVDCWATWCGPCQEPTDHLNKVAGKMKQEWQGKVELIALSQDEDLFKLKKHISKKGWNQVPQYWIGKEARSFKEKYRMVGIPTAYLIDQKGVIVGVVHPGEINLKAEITTLLNKHPSRPKHP